jgi:shikimate dehydrogenase
MSATDLNAGHLYAVLGNPVAHSQSPFIHAEFARLTGQVMRYERRLCALGGFADALKSFVDEGGRGCNITVPFKFDAQRVAHHCSERVRLAGAANVLRWEGDGWSAENTDGQGLVHDIERNAGMALAGKTVLLAGAGGAAAGVLGPLLQRAPARVVLVNRTHEKAAALAQRHAELAALHAVQLEVVMANDVQRAFDVAINATSSSLTGGAPPFPAAALRAGSLAVDLMYGAATRPFLDWAQQQGATPRDGLGMLVEQAALAFFFWRGVLPPTAAVLQALRERLSAAA